MPIYEYKCEQCGKVINLFQKYNARPHRVCSGCLGNMKRIMSKNTFQLKGGGWFQDPPKPPEKEKNDDDI